MGGITNRALGNTRYWIGLPWAVLTVGAVASLLLFAVVRDAVESVAHQRFERLASDTRHVIQARIDSYGEILYGLAALFSSQESVSRLQFHQYVKSLDLKKRFPGFDVLNFAVHVRAEDKQRFEESVRRDTSLTPEGYPNFAIKPPGERPEYYVLVYVEPMAGFEFAFGLDTSVNPAVKDSKALTASINRTRDSGKLNSPGLPIRIKRGGKEYIGLGMRLGVYRSRMARDTVEERRAAFFGSVGAGFNVENLMQDILDGETQQYLRFVLYGAEYTIDDSGSGSKKKRLMLFDSAQKVKNPVASSDSYEPGQAFAQVLPMEIGGREWEVHFSAPKAAIINRVDAIFPWLVLTGGFLSSVLLFGMIYSLTSSRSRAVALASEMTRDLRQSEEELRHSAEQLQALSRRLVDVQESERRQFSRELHDRVGQNLTALSINLDILKTQLPGESSQAVRVRLHDAAALLEDTAVSIENVMSELRPPMLDDYGLLAAVRWYAKQFSRRTGIEVDVEGDEAMKRLSQAGEIALFRIMQESLNNVAKHAQASRVEIRLEPAGADLVMSVSDDGRGLGTAHGASGRRRPGLGMVTMRERTQAVGGRFEIGAAPGGGTRIEVRVPC